MTPPRSTTPSPSHSTPGLDVASSLINEANALLRQHGTSDGIGDDLPVLTEVIFDLGEESHLPPAPAAPQPAPVAPAAPSHPKTTAPSADEQPAKPQNNPPPSHQPASSALPKPQASAIPPLRRPVSAASTSTPNAQPPTKPQTSVVPPRAQTAALASTVQPPKPPIGSTLPPRPAIAPRIQTATVTPKPSSPGVQPPKAPVGTVTQRLGTPPVPSATVTATKPLPSSQTGLATRLPSPSQFQSQLQNTWSQTTSLSAPFSAESPPKPQTETATASPEASVAPATTQAALPPAEQVRAITEDLKLLDTLIIGEVEAWLREELPALVVREISRLNERLRTEAIAHLRTTLLPRISEHISGQIEKIGQSGSGS